MSFQARSTSSSTRRRASRYTSEQITTGILPDSSGRVTVTCTAGQRRGTEVFGTTGALLGHWVRTVGPVCGVWFPYSPVVPRTNAVLEGAKRVLPASSARELPAENRYRRNQVRELRIVSVAVHLAKAAE